MAKVQPSHRAVLRRGIRTADDYMRLVRTLLWDASNGLVSPVQAGRLLTFMMPAHLRGLTFTKAETEEFRRKCLDALSQKSGKRKRGRKKAT